jgi:EmrB/QacA subfamily drug resistance transporter
VSAATTSASPSGAVLTHRQILLIIFGLMGGMFLGALDQTIVGTSMRTIADDLHGLDQQAWVTTAYLITSTIMTPIYGKLSDIFGRRPLFLIAISIFLIGSVAATFSWSMYSLAAFRAVQGLGAGGLMSLPLAIMGDILAPRERARYQGYFLAVFGISSVIGPLIGGLFAGAPEILFITGWRWVFLINLPIGVVATILVVSFLHVPHHRGERRVRIDWWGATLVVVALVPLLLVAEKGRDWGWSSPGAIACYVVGVLGIVGFVIVERAMHDDAIIPLKLFRNATFSMSTVLGILVGFGMFGAMMTLPLYLQLVQGATPTESGFYMLPMILGLMIASITSGQLIARTGKYRAFPTVGTGLMAAGFLYLTFLTYDKPIWFVMIGMLIIGLGLGQLMQTLTIASQNSAAARDMGVATSASTFFRQIGGTLGTAVLFSVLFTRMQTTIADAFTDKTLLRKALNAALDPTVAGAKHNAGIMDAVYQPIVDRITKSVEAQYGAGAAQVLADPSARGKIVDGVVSQIGSGSGGFSSGGGATSSLDSDTSFLTSASHALKDPLLQGFSNAAVTVYWVAFGVVIVAFVLSWFLKTPPLRQVSALQEAADQRAADQAAELDAAIAAQRAADQTGALVEVGTGTIDAIDDGSGANRR